MAKAQFPIDGKLGKDFKVTSYMGMRIHPVTEEKKHHNGTDIWSSHEPCWIEAPYDSKVIYAGPSKIKGANGEPGGFGYYVQLLMKIDGKYYVDTFAHMQKGSIKVKVGQKIEAGTPLGKMGTTGMSTGKHLHWEHQLGKKYVWSAVGKNFIEPIAFFKALIAKEKAIASAAVIATDADPVSEAPSHTEAEAEALEVKRQEQKAATKSATPVAAPEKPKVDKVESKSYTIKPGDSYWAIAAAHPVEGKLIADCVKKLQDLNNNKALKPGEKLVLY